MDNKFDRIKRICVVDFLIPLEGCGPMTPDGRFKAYPDPGNKKTGLPITIGYGITFDATGKPINITDVWTLEQVLEVKELILNKFLAGLLGLSPSLLEAPDRKVAAVLSFVYNCGLGNYRISTFRKRIQEEDWDEAAIECMKWNKAQGKVMKGLTVRRKFEAKALLD